MGMNTLVKKVLTIIGIKPERFSLQWASAAEAPRFVRLITEFTDQIEKLGPLGEAEGIAPDELQQRLEKGLAVLSDRKVRMFFGNATKAIRKEGDFTQKTIAAVIEEKMTKTLTAAFEGKPDADKVAEKTGKTSAPKKTKKAASTKKKGAAAKKKSPAKKKK